PHRTFPQSPSAPVTTAKGMWAQSKRQKISEYGAGLFAPTLYADVFRSDCPPHKGAVGLHDMHADEAEMREYCRANISRQKVPKYFRFVTEFPLTASGKVKKFELRERLIKELGLEDLAK